MIAIYKCTCFKYERTVCVPDRVPGSDIMTWMDVVGACLAYDHKAISPMCRKVEMEYAKLPADNPDGVGIPVTKQ